MSSFNWKKNIEDSLKDGIIITIEATELFFGLKTLNVAKPSKTSKLDATDIITFDGGICGKVLVKDYATYKKWINK